MKHKLSPDIMLLSSDTTLFDISHSDIAIPNCNLELLQYKGNPHIGCEAQILLSSTNHPNGSMKYLNNLTSTMDITINHRKKGDRQHFNQVDTIAIFKYCTVLQKWMRNLVISSPNDVSEFILYVKLKCKDFRMVTDLTITEEIENQIAE